MYNLRYHLASLVAVFLALAVGLLLGTLVAERGMISEQTGALVADLQSRFDEITVKNAELQTGLERDRAFAESAVAPLVAGQLAGNNVAILVGTGRIDGVSTVADAVASAGGTSLTITLEKTALGMLEEEPAGLAGYLQLRGVEMAPPGDDLVQQVSEALIAEWRTGPEQPLTSLLVADGLLSIESSSGTSTVDAVVVMDTGEAGSDPFALAVAQAMTVAGGTTVGVESAPTADGVAAAFVSEGLSAVDHVATPQGRLSLVWILAGRVRGYFGSGEKADAYYPPLAP
ncbi:MAG: hypothetical protein EG823_08920 [Actinobacteria bacterium]|nr:hypothetical protein [Actinomycetota bacterium]